MNENLTFKVADGDTDHNVTFHASKGFGFPFNLNLAADVTEKVHQAHIQIMPFEKELLNWMSLSNENAKLFLQDPFNALEKSKINVPQEVIDSIKNASNLLTNNLKK
nr:hypothetical protein [uncultured Flavobacterium sp.]